MITTLNRAVELERTLPLLRLFDPAPLEVWVVADGCTDGTVDLVRDHFPEVKLIVHDEPQGSVGSRVEIMDQVKGNFVLALDDDSYPERMDCLSTLEKFFEENPKVAIATFPQHTDEYPETLNQTDFGELRQVRSYPNCGAFYRMSVYRELPGFEPMFFHTYEEPDYALQCVANEWDVVLIPEIVIRHHYSGLTRNEMRNHHRHARNEFWSTLIRCPFPHLIGMIAYRIFSQARFATKRGLGWLLSEPKWWWQALLGIPHALKQRAPVSWEGYRRWLKYGDSGQK